MKTYYDIYLLNEDEENFYYVAKHSRKKIFKRCTFKISQKGGLNLVISPDKLDLNNVNTIKPILENVYDFIPINGYTIPLFSEDEVYIPQVFYNILENDYLKDKEKYILCDGIPKKIRNGYIYKEYKFGYECPIYKIYS